LVVRRGKNRALIAIGHKILCASYHIIKNKEAFKELGYEYLAERKKKNRLEYLKRELKEHGYKIEKAAKKKQKVVFYWWLTPAYETDINR